MDPSFVEGLKFDKLALPSLRLAAHTPKPSDTEAGYRFVLGLYDGERRVRIVTSAVFPGPGR